MMYQSFVTLTCIFTPILLVIAMFLWLCASAIVQSGATENTVFFCITQYILHFVFWL